MSGGSADWVGRARHVLQLVMCLELAGAGRDKRCGCGLGIGTVCAARKDANRGSADWVGRATQVLLQAKLADVDMLSGNDRRARAVLCLGVGLAHHALRVVSQGATDVGRGSGVLAGRCLMQRVCTVHCICTRRALPARRCTLRGYGVGETQRLVNAAVITTRRALRARRCTLVWRTASETQRLVNAAVITTRRALPARRCTLVAQTAEHRNIILVGIMRRRKRRLRVAAILHAAWSMRVHACGSTSTCVRWLTYQTLTKIDHASTTNFAQLPNVAVKSLH